MSRRKRSHWRANKIKNRLVKDSTGQYFYTANTLDTSLDSSTLWALINKGYLHSTIAGFNAAYTQLTETDRILDKTSALKKLGYSDLQKALLILRDATVPVIDKIWGEPLPGKTPKVNSHGIPTLDHHRIAYTMLHNSPAALVSQRFLDAYEKWIKAHTAYNNKGLKNAQYFQNISTLKKPALEYLAAARALLASVKRYDALAEQILGPGATAQKANFNRKNYATAIQHLESWSSLEEAGSGQISNKVSAFHNMTETLSKFFGLEVEPSRGMDLWLQGIEPGDVPTQIQQGNIKNVKFAAGSTELSDFTFDVEVPIADDYQMQRMGVSVKHRTFDNFSLDATFNIPDESTPILRAILYLYSNMMALATFARDKEQSYGRTRRRKQVSYNARYNKVKAGMSTPLRTAMEDFHQYLTYRLLLSEFFGNTTSAGMFAGQGSPLDEDFFDRIIERSNKNNEPPPHFVMTGKHVYCTYQILEHYFHEQEKNTKEWKQLLKLQTYTTGFDYTQLIDVWKEKSDILEAADHGNPIHGAPANISVYRLMLQNFDKIFGPLKGNKSRIFTLRLQHSIKL